MHLGGLLFEQRSLNTMLNFADHELVYSRSFEMKWQPNLQYDLGGTGS